jgi:hypothetical protein
VNTSSLLHPKHRAERTAKDNPWPARVARVGIVARGMIHLLVGWLAIRIAMGNQNERADQRGALMAVVRQPLGRVLVLLLAVGFLAYAAWRALEAAVDPDDKGAIQRVGFAGRALLYLGLFGSAVSLAMHGSSGSSGGGSGGARGQKVTAGVLGMPFGRVLVVAAALIIIGTGLWNGYRAITRKFEKGLKKAEMSETERRWTTRVGFVGHLARMVAYGVVGGFLLRAAIRFDPQQPVGLDQSLHALAGEPLGTALLVVVGAGLIAFGIYQLVLARYREILDN